MSTVNANDVSPSDGYWLSGLADGEASFTLMARRRRLERYRDRTFRTVQFTFGITLRADDIDTLRQVHKILGVGRFDHRPGMAKPMRDPMSGKVYTANPRFTLRVFKRDDIARVAAVFDRFPLRSKKRRDYVKWREAFAIYQAAIAEQKRKYFSRQTVERPSLKRRRPAITEPRQRFYKIPEKTWERIDNLCTEIKAGREYAGTPGL